MPNRDGTGPSGAAAQTGKSRGSCSRSNEENRRTNRFGFGRCRRMNDSSDRPRRGRCENRRR